MTEGHYCQEFVSKCTPFFIQGFNSIYKNTLKKCSKRKFILKEFQEALESIPLWNSKIIENEYSRFKNASNCNWLEDLIKAAFVELSEIISKEKKKLDDDIPKGEVFIHKCYINIAREIWRKPQLFYHEYSNTEKTQNHSEITKIIHDVISKTIRNELPLQTIVDDYLNQQHKKVKEDDVHDDDDDDDVNDDVNDDDDDDDDVHDDDVHDDDVHDVNDKKSLKYAFGINEVNDSMKTIVFDGKYQDTQYNNANKHNSDHDNNTKENRQYEYEINEEDTIDNESNDVVVENVVATEDVVTDDTDANTEDVVTDDTEVQEAVEIINDDIIVTEDIEYEDSDKTDETIDNLDTNVILKVNENNIEISDVVEESDEENDFDIKIEEDNDFDIKIEEENETLVIQREKHNKKIRNTEKIKSILGTSIEYDEFKYNKDQLKKKLLLQKKYI